MIRENDIQDLKLALPTGRLQKRILELLFASGIKINLDPRNYRPICGLEGVSVKCLKPQSIPASISLGSRDIGFCGADWAFESGGDLVELLNTGFDPVKIVVAAPKSLLINGRLPDRPLIIASEYQRWPESYVRTRSLNAILLATRGTTEVLPPEDADMIIDNTATGTTLAANNLEIIEVLFESTTRLYANRLALEQKEKRQKIDLILNAVKIGLDRVIPIIPAKKAALSAEIYA